MSIQTLFNKSQHFNLPQENIDKKENDRLLFISKFPIDTIKDLSIDQYVQGTDENSFCYWLEFKKILFGIGGGNASKFGVYKAKDGNYYSSYGKNKKELKGKELDDFFSNIKSGILLALKYTERNEIEKIKTIEIPMWNMVVQKILSIYFPDKFLTIGSPYVLIECARDLLIEEIELEPENSIQINFECKKVLSSLPEYKDWSYNKIGTFIWESYVDDSKRDYYILGSKYGANNDEDIFPDMINKGAIAIGFASNINLGEFYCNNQIEITEYLKEKGEEPKSYNALKYFLNLKVGDRIAVKADGSPKGKKGFLSIIGIAEVIEKDGEIYRHDPNGLGHLINVKFIKAPIYKEFDLGGYGRTIHKLSNSDHIDLIFKNDYEIIKMNIDKDFRLEFSSWLIKKYGENSGTNSSYINAIDVLSQILSRELFKISDENFFKILYQDLIKEQKNTKGKYYNSSTPSYGSKGFYSASVKQYLEFLNSLNLNISKFKELILDFDAYIKKGNTILNQFEINPKYFGKNYVGYWDSDKNIGDKIAHYEIIVRKNKLYVEVHFEGSQLNKRINRTSQDIFSKTINTLPKKAVWFDWNKSKSIRFDEIFSFEDIDIIQKLANALLYLEENLGDQLRAIKNDTFSHLEKNHFMTDMLLNKILYGPPGTGKTYRLQKEYFDKFTIKETALSRDQYLNSLIGDLSWWQTISIAVLDLGFAKVNEIHEHEFIRVKEKLSSSKNVKPIIWSCLQSHAVMDCPNVNVTVRMDPLFFNKSDDSKWTVDHELLEQYYPEAFEILEKSKNFVPDTNKSIKNYEFITFHQSFSYEDFIEGIKPKLDDSDKDVSFEIKDGVFKKLCLKAEADSANDYAIFIDEINRGNVSAIFGELITLIENDKRIGGANEIKVRLPYSKSEFGVPSNLFIIGTMNTADRSVEALDTALRRRFSFTEIMPDSTLLNKIEFNGFTLDEVLETINERIEVLLDRDHTIGHSYFLKLESGDVEGLKSVFANNIIPLLQEYFYHDYEKIALILGEGFIKIKENKTVKFANFKNIDSPEIANQFELISSIDDIENAISLLLTN